MQMNIGYQGYFSSLILAFLLKLFLKNIKLPLLIYISDGHTLLVQWPLNPSSVLNVIIMEPIQVSPPPGSLPRFLQPITSRRAYRIRVPAHSKLCELGQVT